MKIRLALVSVSDKSGIVDFCKSLSALGVEIISTGGTAKTLKEGGVKVIPIEEHTGFPEIMDGRVKTLHPKIHGGILAMREKHADQAKEHGIKFIDMVVVNLYPFEKTVEKEDVPLPEAIENIDIGGPSMIRSAAKNYRDVVVVTDPSDYARVLSQLKGAGDVDVRERERLAVKAFRRTAEYDSSIERFLARRLAGEEILHLKFRKGEKLRYGENWHQKAKFFRDVTVREACLANARQLAGKEMSYNNYVDADAALEAVKDLEICSVAVVKHTNPCGYATGGTPREALEAAWDGDQVSAFGSVIAFNRPVDLESTKFLEGKFVEIILAPGFEKDALEELKKRKNLRILELQKGNWERQEKHTYKHITGGILQQDRDVAEIKQMKIVTKEQIPTRKLALASFAAYAAKHTKSNAIVIAREYRPGFYHVIGMGAGQPNRIDSLRKLALPKAMENIRILYDREKGKTTPEEFEKKILNGCVLASDAFFPFPDTVEEAARGGIRYIVQPGGSVRDSEVIAAADRLGIAMAFTGIRSFRH